MIPILLLFPLLSDFQLLYSVETLALDLRVDKLENTYLIHNDHIEKLDAKGNMLFRSSDPGFGQITDLNVSDPMKPFLFFADQGIIYPMDNTLSLQGNTLQLFASSMQVLCVGWSRDNHYWLWDANRSELVRVDRALNRVNATGNIQRLLGLSLSPTQIIEIGGYWVYVYDPINGLFIFDVFGNYYSNKMIYAKNGIQVLEDAILYHDGKNLHVLAKSLIDETEFALEEPPQSSLQKMNNLIYYLSGSKFLVYEHRTSASKN